MLAPEDGEHSQFGLGRFSAEVRFYARVFAFGEAHRRVFGDRQLLRHFLLWQVGFGEYTERTEIAQRARRFRNTRYACKGLAEETEFTEIAQRARRFCYTPWKGCSDLGTEIDLNSVSSANPLQAYLVLRNL